jgi:hypothetical protein
MIDERRTKSELAELRSCLTDCMTDRLRLYGVLQQIADADGARAATLRKMAKDAKTT